MEMLDGLDRRISIAVQQFWRTRDAQARKQTSSGRKDQGARGSVTGGAQMNGFIDLLAELIRAAGIPDADIHRNSRLELPGYYRPTKKWDLVVVREGQLVCVIEAKSQVGPSFGNNFNNRIEEAIGSAEDIWTAYRERAINADIRPWLGYLFLLEDCPATQLPMKPREPHFPVLPEFKSATYALRYTLFCQKLVREGKYTVATFLTADRGQARSGGFQEPAEGLRFKTFARSLVNHVASYAP